MRPGEIRCREQEHRSSLADQDPGSGHRPTAEMRGLENTPEHRIRSEYRSSAVFRDVVSRIEMLDENVKLKTTPVRPQGGRRTHKLSVGSSFFTTSAINC